MLLVEICAVVIAAVILSLPAPRYSLGYRLGLYLRIALRMVWGAILSRLRGWLAGD